MEESVAYFLRLLQQERQKMEGGYLKVMPVPLWRAAKAIDFDSKAPRELQIRSAETAKSAVGRTQT